MVINRWFSPAVKRPALQPKLHSQRPNSWSSSKFAVCGRAPRRGYSTIVNPADDLKPPLEHYRRIVAKDLSSASGLPAARIQPLLRPSHNLERGDLVLPIPSLSFKDKTQQKAFASRCVSSLSDTLWLERPVATKNFLEFKFKATPLIKLVVNRILTEGDQYGKQPGLGLKDKVDGSSGPKTVVVEFSSPNIAKHFHAGHLRSTIIGAFIANIHEAMGWKAVRLNYLGDWGRQFGLIFVGFERYGNEKELAANPIGHLYDIYVKVNADAVAETKAVEDMKASLEAMALGSKDYIKLKEYLVEAEADSAYGQARKLFKRMEEGDHEALAAWKRFRNFSIDEYSRAYERLNIRFDIYAGESGVDREQMKSVNRRFAAADILESDGGAQIVDFSRLKGARQLGKAVIEKNDGSSIYLSRDVSEAIRRHTELHFDKMLYVVASQQNLHMAQLFKLLEAIGEEDIASKSSHINFGMVQGMSTRKGTVTFLNDILNDAKGKMFEVMGRNQDKLWGIVRPEETADILGITAVMVQDMKAKRHKDYDFSLERMTALVGDTGPYLQYSHARLCTISRRAVQSKEELLSADLSVLTETSAADIARILLLWPDILLNAYNQLEPSIVINYLFRLSHALNRSYHELRVIGSEPRLKIPRGALYEASRQVLGNGMKLLGLTPLERV